MVGCRLPISKPLPPRTTLWSMDTLSPTTDVWPTCSGRTHWLSYFLITKPVLLLIYQAKGTPELSSQSKPKQGQQVALQRPDPAFNVKLCSGCPPSLNKVKTYHDPSGMVQQKP